MGSNLAPRRRALGQFVDVKELVEAARQHTPRARAHQQPATLPTRGTEPALARLGGLHRVGEDLGNVGRAHAFVVERDIRPARRAWGGQGVN